MHAKVLRPPYPVRRSPDVAAARSHSARWAHEIGILAAPESGFRVWDERDFSDFDFALFGALVHPSARGDLLNLVADWYVWGWYLDDLMLHRFKRPRDLLGAQAFLKRLSAFACGSPPRPANPAERGLADLWARTISNHPPAWRDRLGGRLPNLFDDALWEIDNLARGQVPEPVDYLQVRRAAGGALWAAQLVEHVLGLDLPADLMARQVFTRAADAFTDVVDLHNDLVSYRRETEYEQEVSNAVVVFRAHTGDGQTKAADAVERLLDSRLALFDRLITTDIPATLASEAVGADITSAVMRYLDGLKHWLAGDYQWHLETRRYHESSWRRSYRPPTARGIGTSATHPAWTPTTRVPGTDRPGQTTEPAQTRRAHRYLT
ncbi:hypothetical protein OOJ98_16005 [Streptomyces sp. NBC_00083]|nr:hypothetical protein [Streptomyces sp. NBC_00083]